MKTMIWFLVMLLVSAQTSHAAAAAPSSTPAKLWATDLPAFLNDRPGAWIVGHSSDPALSAAEAESSARRDAVGPLFEKLRSRLPRASWGTLLQRIEATLAT